MLPGSDDVYPLTSIPAGQISANVFGLSLELGVTYYSMVRATNTLGVSAESISDVTPPDVGVVLGGHGLGYVASFAQPSTRVLSARWYGFQDVESEIEHYEVAVANSTTPPLPSLYTNVGIGTQTQLTGLSLVPGQTYYVHVVGVNRAAL